MLTREMMDSKLDEHFGFEARDDVEGVLSTLTDDVEHDIVGCAPDRAGGRELPFVGGTLCQSAKRAFPGSDQYRFPPSGRCPAQAG